MRITIGLLCIMLGLVFGLQAQAAPQLNNCGQRYGYPHPPQRVLAYANPALENMLALGLADRLIGVVGYEYARDPAPSPGVSGGISRLPSAYAPPTAESLLLLRPDFVYSASYYWFNSPETPGRDRLTEWGIGSYLSPGACGGQQSALRTALTFEGIFAELRDIARIFGVADRAARLIRQQRSQLRALERQAAALPPQRMLWWYAGTQTPYVAGCCGAPALLARTVGGENLFGDLPELWPNVSWEIIAARDPDVIVLGDLPRGGLGDSAADKIRFLERHPLTATLRAVRQRRYVIVPGYDMDPSARTLAALGRLIQGLQRQASGPQPPNKEP
ncbi:vitamin B12-transporter protein BtuF [Serratia entomophila]|jgi:iron complex transport system substrate-binding protein|uniref:ABC transporter substrate-binding protein n=1 Tax=Serratia entomophila TaxID=42906 RepID=UPI00217CAE0A|nr:ABC transporter substrate-binding protein [Serratia entomophila]CAI0911789.1 vitamin B12-transporter protein BtuF [Serratia entomophila]CAI1729571.1 vitamin B12-transporter protein BtuF [Serratia entomophila]CAI1796532.1 vitamin B12-transporter protein BtuF [Serratia entomophila]